MKIKILYITPASPDRGFLKNDVELLEKYYKVHVIIFNKLSLLLIFKLFKGVLWSDITFSWFAATHAFWAVLLSKLFRKKSIVVIGGYEVANVPEIGYGAMSSPKSARRVKYVLKNADKLLAVSEFNKKEILKYENPENVELVYNGINMNKFKPKEKKENLVIAVGGVKKLNLKRKGFETFVKSAKYLPNTKFVLIGPHLDNSIEYLKSISPSNVKFTGFVSDEELLKWYQRAKVYCQLSIYESFGVALAEAMLCECVPVVTNNAALPEVVGDTGLYVPYGDPKATIEAIKEALKQDKGKAARERIKSMFPMEKREKALISIIGEICK